MAPVRHLYLDRQSLLDREAEPVSPQTSWLQAPPQQLAIRFRKTGSYTRRGKTNDVIDRSDQKRLLEALVREGRSSSSAPASASPRAAACGSPSFPNSTLRN